MCRVYVGCCGFPFSRSRYYNTFKTVEVQQTFYDPPSKDTLARWRGEAPADFIFHVKAWQAVTHPKTSPTWRRMKRSLPGNLDNYGLLRPTEENKWAWRVTLEAAKALGAEFIVIQTPPSLGYSRESAAWVRDFLSWAVGEAKGFKVGWEPRGDWHEHMDELRGIVCGAGIIHVVDPFRRKPVICDWQKEVYFRLHGIGRGEVNYRYKYTDQDLERLAETVGKLIDGYGLAKVYVMFNNIYMGQDAQRFREVARAKGLNVC